jgi:uncharacterized protein YjbI with pentapeptide repeats
MKFLFGPIVVGISSLLVNPVNPNWTAAAMAAEPSPSTQPNPQQLERLLKTNQCPLCDLRGANLENANLYGANLVGANLTGANLRGTNLGAANLSDANLTNANLDRAYLHQVTFEDANFQGANLANAYLKSADLTRVNLSGATLQNANLRRANLVGSNLTNANLEKANLAGALLTGITLPPDFGRLGQVPGQIRTSLCERDTRPTEQELVGAKEAGFELSLAELEGVNLRGANLREAVLVAGNLRQADLRDADLSQACLNLADLTEAKLDRANLKDTKLQAALLEGASLKDLRNADLSQAYRTQADAKRAPIEAQAQRAAATLTRAQQAFQLEKIKFAETVEELGVPTNNFPQEYEYKVVSAGAKQAQVMLVAQPKSSGYRLFIGIVAIVVDPQTQAARTNAILCASQTTTQKPPVVPNLKLGELPACPSGYGLANS